MRINHLLVSLVATAAACTDASTVDTDHSTTEVIRPTRPLTKKLPQAEAVVLCGVEAHAPTVVEAQQLFADCTASGDGFACVPFTSATEMEGSFWTTTPCEVSGFYVGDFATGEITCNATHEASAQPLCVH